MDQEPPSKTSSNDKEALRTQYNKLAEDWRQLNSMLWAIPTVAVSIMAGIIVAAYQEWIVGMPRLVSLAIGALLLGALTFEVIKKGVYMRVITRKINLLQEHLPLPEDCKFNPDSGPDGVAEEDVKPAMKAVVPAKKNVNRFDNRTENPFYQKLHFATMHARQVLAWVMILAAVGVAFLALMETVI